MLLGLLCVPAQSHAFCFVEAGREYGINPAILWSIAKNESGMNPSALNRNKNGTYDYGLMQINSIWARTLGRDVWSRISDPCLNTRVGAWILSQCIARHGYTWQAIGCYHSGTPKLRDKYARKVYATLLDETQMTGAIGTLAEISVTRR